MCESAVDLQEGAVTLGPIPLIQRNENYHLPSHTAVVTVWGLEDDSIDRPNGAGQFTETV